MQVNQVFDRLGGGGEAFLKSEAETRLVPGWCILVINCALSHPVYKLMKSNDKSITYFHELFEIGDATVKLLVLWNLR